MDSFEWNKTLMAILCALLLLKTVDLISCYIIHPKMLAKNVFVVDGIESPEPQATQAEATIQPIEPLLAAANIENGQKIAKQCLQCHTLNAGGKNMVGPNLHNVVGRKAASIADYSYSSAMKNHNVTWDPESLNRFLTHPRIEVQGTKMSFIGLKKIEDRRDIIAYLKTLKD